MITTKEEYLAKLYRMDEIVELVADSCCLLPQGIMEEFTKLDEELTEYELRMDDK